MNSSTEDNATHLLPMYLQVQSLTVDIFAYEIREARYLHDLSGLIDGASYFVL